MLISINSYIIVSCNCTYIFFMPLVLVSIKTAQQYNDNLRWIKEAKHNKLVGTVLYSNSII